MRTYGVHGGERQLAQLFSSFDDAAFQHLFFFVYRDDQCNAFFQKLKKLRCKNLLPLKSRTFPRLMAELGILMLLLPFLQIRFCIELFKHDCRIIVAHGVQGAMVAWLAALLLRRRNFVYVHRGTKSKLGKHPIFKLLYLPFGVVAGVSKASSESLKTLVNSSKLNVLENGIDLSAFLPRNTIQKSPSAPIVLTGIGRLIPAKGQNLLIEAFAIFVRTFPNAELRLVGDGPDEEALKQLTAQLKIQHLVRFVGHSAKIIDHLQETDIFVGASESEGLSNAVLEAMAMSLPSVVVDAPGVTECHVDGETGFVTLRDANAIAAKLMLLSTQSDLRAKMGCNARTRVEDKYSIEANWQRYAKLYRHMFGYQ